MHKVHHHWKQPYTDSNYGAMLSIWDRLLGTYMKLKPGEIRYGLDRYYPNEKDEDFMMLMKKPFQKQDVNYIFCPAIIFHFLPLIGLNF